MKTARMAVLLCIAVLMTGCIDIIKNPLHPTRLSRPVVQVYLISAGIPYCAKGSERSPNFTHCKGCADVLC